MEDKSTFSGKIDSIQLLRVVAALGVALYHIQFVYEASGLNLAFGVHLFFTISAFLSMYTTQNKKKHYVGKRLIRIVPLYWIMTFATFIAAKALPGLMPSTQADMKSLAFSMFFIPYSRDGLRAENMIRPLVGPAWTLNYEIFFMVIFAMAMLISYRYRGIITVAILTIFLSLGRLLEINNAILQFWTAPYLADFIAGIGAFYILKYLNDKQIGRRGRICLAVMVIMAGALMVWNGYPQPRWVINAALSLAMLVSSVLALRGVRIPSMLLRLGDTSFSFYLIHYYVIIIIAKVFGLQNANVKSFIGLALVFVVSEILADISYALIEKRLTKTLTKVLFRE